MGYNGMLYIYISIRIYGKCDGIYQHHKVEQDLPFFLRKNIVVIPSVPCWKTVTQVEFSAGISVFNNHMASADMLAHPFISYQVGDTSHYIPIVFQKSISYIPFSISDCALPIAIYECCLRKKLQNYTLWILDL